MDRNHRKLSFSRRYLHASVGDHNEVLKEPSGGNPVKVETINFEEYTKQ